SAPQDSRGVREGDVVTIGGRRWHAFPVMGHAPEHACLFCPELNVLISGDQVLPKITTNVSVWPDQPKGNPLQLYLASLGRFRPLPEETLVLPSHGLPFRRLHLRLDFLRHHHEERLAPTMGSGGAPRPPPTGSGPPTPWPRCPSRAPPRSWCPCCSSASSTRTSSASPSARRWRISTIWRLRGWPSGW